MIPPGAEVVYGFVLARAKTTTDYGDDHDVMIMMTVIIMTTMVTTNDIQTQNENATCVCC